MRFYQKIIISTGFFLFLGITDGTASAIFRKKKPKSTATPSVYKQLTGRDSVQMLGVMNALQKGDTFYLEFPTKYLGREFLITNKLQKVPLELNEAGVNKGINYENQSVKFEWDKAQNRILIRQQRLTPE